MKNLLPFVFISSIWVISTLLSFTPFVLTTGMGKSWEFMSIGLVPLIFIFAFPIVAGLLSRLAQKGIVAGKFPRETTHPVYFLRRIYGLCWTQVYYCKPVYAVVLGIPMLKNLVFRIFGYKGSPDFTVYPDTWIRDLPLLNVGSGAYLSNRATIGTNICLSDGNILVDGIKIETKGMVGHLAMLAPGARVGESAEVGVGCAVGIRTVIKKFAAIKPTCTLNHGAVIGEGADIGTMSFIGLRAEIGTGIKLPAGSNIPAGASIQTQEDVQRYLSSETENLHEHRAAIAEILSRNHHVS